MRRLGCLRKTIRLPVLAVLILLLSLGGCSKKGKVTGTVKFNGQPLPGGTITFDPEQGGGGGTFTIKEDGTYTADKLPMGKMLVGITPVKEVQTGSVGGRGGPPGGLKIERPAGAPPRPEGAGSADLGKSAGHPVEGFPKDYEDPKKSGLSFEVKGGSNTYNPEVPGPGGK